MKQGVRQEEKAGGEGGERGREERERKANGVKSEESNARKMEIREMEGKGCKE